MKYIIIVILCLTLSGCAYAKWYGSEDEQKVIALSLTGMEAKRGDKSIEVKHPLGFLDNLFNFAKK